MDFKGSKTRIYLIRHGEVEGHEIWSYNSQSDVPLSAKGVLQYHELVTRLSNIDIKACYTSDLTRCVVGAKILAEHFQVEVTKRKELREINMGQWTGMSLEEIMKNYPEEWLRHRLDLLNHRVTNGENLLDVSLRVTPLIEEIVKKHLEEEVIIIGHGGINRVILLNALQAPLNSLDRIGQNYGSLNIIDYYESGHVIVRALNA